MEPKPARDLKTSSPASGAPLSEEALAEALALAIQEGSDRRLLGLARQAARMPRSSLVGAALKKAIVDKGAILSHIYASDDQSGLGAELARCCGIHSETPDLWRCHRIMCTELVGAPVFEICKALLARMEAEGVEPPHAIPFYDRTLSPWEALLLEHAFILEPGQCEELARMLARTSHAPIPTEFLDNRFSDDSIYAEEALAMLGGALGCLKGAPQLSALAALADWIDSMAAMAHGCGRDGQADAWGAEATRIGLAHGMELPHSMPKLKSAAVLAAIEAHALEMEMASKPADHAGGAGTLRI